MHLRRTYTSSDLKTFSKKHGYMYITSENRSKSRSLILESKNICEKKSIGPFRLESMYYMYIVFLQVYRQKLYSRKPRKLSKKNAKHRFEPISPHFIPSSKTQQGSKNLNVVYLNFVRNIFGMTSHFGKKEV